MSKKSQFVQDLVRVSLMAAVIAIAMPELSMAAGSTTGSSGGDLGTTTQYFAANQLKSIPNLITAVCYILGIILMVAGSLKLRAYSENPGNTPLSHGLGRLMVGGAIASLPSLTGWINSTTQISGSSLSNSKFSVDFSS